MYHSDLYIVNSMNPCDFIRLSYCWFTLFFLLFLPPFLLHAPIFLTYLLRSFVCSCSHLYFSFPLPTSPPTHLFPGLCSYSRLYTNI